MQLVKMVTETEKATREMGRLTLEMDIGSLVWGHVKFEMST